MEELAFGINRWFSWEPIESQLAYCIKSSHADIQQSMEKSPDISFLPAIQRRRLSPLARVVFQALHHCTDIGAQTPVIFSSHFGEINRTFSILDDISQNQPISPMAFSLSVHNALAGQWSIATANKAPMIALAPGRTGPLAALLEACGILQEERFSHVTIVFYDENLPTFYQPFSASPLAPSAIAIEISTCTHQQQQRQFEINRIPSSPSHILNTNNIVKLLRGDKQEYIMGEGNNCWAWRELSV